MPSFLNHGRKGSLAVTAFVPAMTGLQSTTDKKHFIPSKAYSMNTCSTFIICFIIIDLTLMTFIPINACRRPPENIAQCSQNTEPLHAYIRPQQENK